MPNCSVCVHTFSEWRIYAAKPTPTESRMAVNSQKSFNDQRAVAICLYSVLTSFATSRTKPRYEISESARQLPDSGDRFALVANSPDRSVGVLGHEERAVIGDRNSDRSSPNFGIAGDKSSKKVLIFAGG